MNNTLSTVTEMDNIEIASSIKCDIDDLNKLIEIKQNDLTIVSQNIRSVYSNLDDLNLTLSSLSFLPDLVILTECRLQSNKPIPALTNYTTSATTHHLNQNDGVVAYVRNTIQANTKEIILDDASCIQIELQDNIILGIYRSPSNNNAELFINSLSSYLESTKSHKNITVTGDLNINLISKNNEQSYEFKNRNNFLNMLTMHGILPGHSLPTRDDSCLDHFMLKLDKGKVRAQIAVLNTTITDHCMILLALANLNLKRNDIKTKVVTDFDQAIISLTEKNLQELLFCENPDTLIELLVSKITESLAENTKTIRVPKIRRTLKPWITPGILRCIRNRNKMQKKLRSDPTDEILKITYRRYRNYCNNLIKKLKRAYEKQQLAASTKNPKSLWTNIKSITNLQQARTDNTHLLRTKSDPLESVDDVNKYFANVGKILAEKICLPPNNDCENLVSSSFSNLLNSFALIDTDPIEVHDILINLKTESAPGWDNIPTKFLKLAKKEIVPVIAHMANLCFRHGTFPSYLKRAVITPVYKGGDRDDVNNYRPISVLSSISKIVEKLMNKRLLSYLEKFRILSESQYGFRQGKSTEDAITDLSSLITDNLDQGKKCLTVFLDLKKAFDTVSVPILLQKLENIGVRGLPLALFKNYLSDRKQCVKIGSFTGQYEDVTYGVPQGSVLGPTLFLVYINDLLNLKVGDARIFSYADDTAIVFTGPNWEAVHSATEKGLSEVYRWLSSNLLTLNAQKTNYICFTINKKTQPKSDLNIKIHNCDASETCSCPTIEKLSATKYLGVQIDENLTWYVHLDLISNRIRKFIWIFKKLRHVASQPLLNKIYVALAQSVASYCIPVWGGATKTKLLEVEKAQRALLKVMYFKPYRFPTERLYMSCDLLTIRKLYVLHTILRKHKHLTYDPIKMSRRRNDIVDKSRMVNTSFARRQYKKQSTYLYNKINKVVEIYTLTKQKCKEKVIKWLKTCSYIDTEELLQYVE